MAIPVERLIAAHDAGRHERYRVHACPRCPRCKEPAPAPGGYWCGRVLEHGGNHVTPEDQPPIVW